MPQKEHYKTHSKPGGGGKGGGGGVKKQTHKNSHILTIIYMKRYIFQFSAVLLLLNELIKACNNEPKEIECNAFIKL